MATKKKTKKTAAPSTWTTQAGMSALLKYGPQLSALDSLYSDAQSEYARQSNNARFLTQQAAAALDKAQGDNQLYTNAALARQKEIGGGTLDPAAATTLNVGSANYGQQLAEERKSNVNRGAFQTQQAGDQMSAQIAKILQQRQQLLAESGDYTALTATQLKTAADKITNDNKQKGLDRDGRLDTALIGQGLDPGTLKPLPGAKSNKAAAVKHNTSATGAPLLSADNHNTARKDILKGWETLADRQKGNPGRYKSATDAELIRQLTTPVPASSVRDPDANTTTSIPAKPGMDPLLAKAVVEQRRHKHISQATVTALADAGYSIKRLRFVTPRQWAQRQAKSRAQNPVGAAAGDVAAGLQRLLGG